MIAAAIALTNSLQAQTRSLQAQARDERARQAFNRLLLDDASLRSEIQGTRIDRQAEISRLEARIMKLEKQVRGFPKQMDHTGFIALVATLEEGQRDAAAPAADVPESQPSSDSDESTEARQRQVLELIARDYMSQLKVEILESQIVLQEHAAQLTSLQRLAAKGLATRPQLDVENLKNTQAEARYARLQQQRKGLLELFPSYFAEAEPSEESLPSPDTKP